MVLATGGREGSLPNGGSSSKDVVEAGVSGSGSRGNVVVVVVAVVVVEVGVSLSQLWSKSELNEVVVVGSAVEVDVTVEDGGGVRGYVEEVVL